MNTEITPDQRRYWAEKLGSSDQYLYQCLTGRRDMGPVEARRIETESNGVLTRKMLCQKTWRGIWPELIDQECAPSTAPTPASRAQAATETVADSDGNEMRDMLTAQRDRAADRVAADPNDRMSAMIFQNRNDALKELAHTPANRAQAATETVAPSSHQADPLDLEHSDQERRDGGRRESERRDGQRRGEEVVVGGV